MLFQKIYIYISDWAIVKIKGRFRKKYGEKFGAYQLLATARKYDQPRYFFSERVKKNQE